MPVVKSKMSVDSAMTIKSNIVKKEERNINNMQNNLASMIKEKKLFLLDIDGTVALGSELLPGAADFPSITDDDKGGVSIGGASLWMLDNQDDAKKAATWEFVKYLVSAESQAYWNAQTGYFPVTTAAHDEQVFKDNIAKYPQFQTAIDQIHDSAPEYAGALLSVFPEARAIVETEVENMLNGKESAEDAMSKMASDMNKSIEDYNLLNE